MCYQTFQNRDYHVAFKITNENIVELSTPNYLHASVLAVRPVGSDQFVGRNAAEELGRGQKKSGGCLQDAGIANLEVFLITCFIT